jgi:sugar/nucleoside kinase (ribokinase family)
MDKKSVLCMGISTMDYLCELDHFPIPDLKVRAKDFCLEGGGNAANTAVSFARLGCRTHILSRVGNDIFGTQCVELFEKEGIDVSLLQVDSVPTSLSIVLVDLSQHMRTIINCSKPATIQYVFSPQHLANIDLLYADGRNIEVYETLLREASQRGIKIAIEAERKTLGSATYFPLANIVFASRRFHREYFGNDAYEANLDTILSLGPEIAVTTLGEEGVIVKTRDGSLHENAIRMMPVDTTGAGDAFNAAFLYGILNHHALHEATKFATRYAAESCKKLGSRAGLLRKEDLT